MRRFRLLSLLLAMIVAGVLLGLNLRGRWCADIHAKNKGSAVAGFYEYGYPSVAIWHQAMEYPRNTHIYFPFDTSEYYLRESADGLVQVSTASNIRFAGIAVDLIFLLTSIAFALGLGEFLLAGRASLAKPEGKG